MLGCVQRIGDRGVGKHDHELFTAVTRAAIDLAGRVAHDLRDHLQHFVAGWMSERIVVLLEVIDVAHQYREEVLALLEPRHLVVETLH